MVRSLVFQIFACSWPNYVWISFFFFYSVEPNFEPFRTRNHYIFFQTRTSNFQMFDSTHIFIQIDWSKNWSSHMGWYFWWWMQKSFECCHSTKQSIAKTTKSFYWRSSRSSCRYGISCLFTFLLSLFTL